MTGNHERLTLALGDRYRIERELGQGGMATVYLAEDLKHHRKVALKVLKPELAAVLGAERFVQEITTTAALQHPHILPLFDSGQAVIDAPHLPGGDVFLYYVMPYVDGETLRDRMKRERQLAVDDAIAITKTIAGALEFAHQHGVIHRDIKPENILLQAGVAVVADFGIALAVKSAGGERLTATGLTIGTPAYMSPEQIAGERDLDARSDVYALACLTYEMLAGDPPFTASNPMAVMAKHMMDPAPPITTTRPNVSASVAKALAKALCKAPADRHNSAAAFSAGLTAERPDDDRSMRSLVVLPFANQSPDPDNEYFVDGLTEEIIAELSRLRGLSVISRNSAMTLKGTKKDTPTIARELRGSHVVTGSVRRAGNALRVRMKLSGTQPAAAVVVPGGRRAFTLQISPDGRWLAFLSTASGRPEVHVRSTDLARSEDWRVATSADLNGKVRWSRGGDELFYMTNESLMAIRVTTSPSFEAGVPRALFSTTGLNSGFDVGADGRFLMIRQRPDRRKPTTLVMLERWTDLLPR